MPQKEKSNALLIVYDDELRFGAVHQMLDKTYGSVHNRDTFVSSLQYLMVQEPDLVIIDAAIGGGRGLELCQAIRTDSSFGNVPLFLVSEDDSTCTAELLAFTTGVDDFVKFPFNLDVLAARINRLITHDLKDALGASLSVQVGAKELPGILQYLETELKTGHLTIEWQDQAAVLSLKEGLLTRAYTSDLDGPEVVTEILSWSMTNVSFVEEALNAEDLKFEAQLTGLLMNASVEVDEYQEIKKTLPSDLVTFSEGSVPLRADAEAEERSIFYAALQDYSVDELLQGITQSERKAAIWLAQLISDGCLVVKPPAFERYRDRCYECYGKGHLDNRLVAVRQNIAQVELPLSDTVATKGVGPADWLSPVPRVLIVGDNSQHLGLLRESLEILYENIFHKRMPTKHISRQTDIIRFDFGNKNALDFVILPSFVKEHFDEDLNEGMEDAIAVLHFASAQDRETCRLARRVHKRLRRRVAGLYLHIVPRVRGQEGGFMFKINCNHCGFKLAVDMEEAGFGGECPVCSKPISIPESIDHLMHALHLNEDMPIVTIEPVPGQCRDLLLLLLDSMLNYCSKEDNGHTDRLETEVRGRIGKHAEKTQIEIAETQFINIAEVLQQETQKLNPGDAIGFAYPNSDGLEEEEEEEEEDASAFAPIPQRAAPEDEDEEEYEPNKTEIEELLGMLSKDSSTAGRLTMISTDLAHGEDDEDDDLDGLLNSLTRDH